MITTDQIFEQIQSDWQEQPVTLDICTSVFSYLIGKEQLTAEYITFELIRKITSYNYDEPAILEAMRYLCASGLLTLGFQFFDENDDVYFLDADDLIEAKEDGYLIHPGNGRDQVTDFEDKVLYYFSPTKLVRKLV